MSKKIGDIGEKLALQYLKRQGLKFIISNFKSKYGEIDLIMQDKNCLVFIEVRLRNTSNYGTPADTITMTKKNRLLKTCYIYLQQQQLSINHTNFRFDFIGISAKEEISWLKNIFN